MHCSPELQIVFGTLFSVFIRQKGNLPVCRAFPLVVGNETLLGFNNLYVELKFSFVSIPDGEVCVYLWTTLQYSVS